MNADARAARRLERLAEELARVHGIVSAIGRDGRPCLCCGAMALTLDGHFQDGGERFGIWSCGACGMAQLDRHMTEDQVSALEDHNAHYQTGETEDVEARVREHAFILDLMHRFVPKGQLLDVGCSHGYKLEAARRAGWEVQGIELSPRSHRVASSLGLPVHLGTLDTWASDGTFTAVIAWHVLEHVASPVLLLAEIWDVLEAGGCLFLQVPSYGQYRNEPDWSAHSENFCRVHYWYFTADALGRLLRDRGFLIEYEYDDPRCRHLTFVARRPAGDQDDSRTMS